MDKKSNGKKKNCTETYVNDFFRFYLHFKRIALRVGMKSKKKNSIQVTLVLLALQQGKKYTLSLYCSRLRVCSVCVSVASERESNGKISRVESTLRRQQRLRRWALVVCTRYDWHCHCYTLHGLFVVALCFQCFCHESFT